MHTLVRRRVADGRDLLARIDGVGALAVDLERGLVFPDLEDHELVRLIDTLDYLAAEVAALVLRGFAVASEHARRIVLRRRHDLDVGHRVDVANARGPRGRGRG